MGGGCDHDVARELLSIQSQGDEVCSLGFAWADVDRLLWVSVPSRFSAQLYPCIANAVVPAEARALHTRESMVTVTYELALTSTSSGQRRVLASLSRLEDRKSQVFLNGKSQGEEVMVGTVIPGHDGPDLPLPWDVWPRGRCFRKARGSKPRAQIVELEPSGLIEYPRSFRPMR